MHLDVRILASPLAFSRIGIVVPRHHHSAVDRNRLKRRLRELVRTELLPLLRVQGSALDVLVRAPGHAYRAEYAALESDLRAVATRLSAEP